MSKQKSCRFNDEKEEKKFYVTRAHIRRVMEKKKRVWWNKNEILIIDSVVFMIRFIMFMRGE